MAIVKNNDILEGLSGKFGNCIIFRQWKNKTIVSSRPRPVIIESKKQRANRDRFRQATEYAKQVMHDPKLKVHYLRKAEKLGLPNAYTAAITDYLRKPVAKNVITTPSQTEVYKLNARATKRDCTINNMTGISITADINLMESTMTCTRNEWILKTTQGLRHSPPPMPRLVYNDRNSLLPT
jgi:hypothetical protein